MKNKIKEKILMLKETKEYIIESKEEYWYVFGAVAEYVTSLSKADNMKMKLKINYCNISNIKQLLNKLCMDFNRYCYDLEPNSRCEKLYSAILNYSENIKDIDKLKFQQGLFEQDKVIYVKNENN